MGHCARRKQSGICQWCLSSRGDTLSLSLNEAPNFRCVLHRRSYRTTDRAAAIVTPTLAWSTSKYKKNFYSFFVHDYWAIRGKGVKFTVNVIHVIFLWSYLISYPSLNISLKKRDLKTQSCIKATRVVHNIFAMNLRHASNPFYPH